MVIGFSGLPRKLVMLRARRQFSIKTGGRGDKTAGRFANRSQLTVAQGCGYERSIARMELMTGALPP